MRHKNRFGLTLLAICALLISPLSSLAAETIEPTVLISEVAWAGSSASASDEWLELTNTGSEDVDLTGWVILGAATSGEPLALPEGSMIEAGSVFLITNYDSSNEKSALAVESQFVTASLSLSNSGLGLVLVDASGTTRDHAGDGGAPFAGSTAGSGAEADGRFTSMVRVSTAPGDQEASWVNGAESAGFDAERTDLGTPGQLDPISSSELEEEAEEEVLEETEDLPGEPAENIETSDEDVVSNTEEETMDTESESNSTSETEADTVEIIETSVESQPVAVYYPIGTLRINEFVSDPVAGEDEWVEIVNPFNNVIDLGGWHIREGSGKQTALPDQLLGFGQFVLVGNPLGKLNNGSDVIQLLDPSGVVIDSLSYGTADIPAPTDPDSLARTEDGTWLVTSIVTPKAPNQFPEPEPEINPAPQPEPVSTPTETHVQSGSTAPISQESITPPAAEADNTEIALDTKADPTGPTSLRLSEVYPNTEGDDAEEEFIELENFGEEPVDLWGWFLEDASGKRFLQAESYMVAAGARIAFYRSDTKLTLNNTSETVRLFAPDGTLVDELSYDRAKEGYVFAWTGTDWAWSSEATPNEPNTFPAGEPALQQTVTGNVSATSSAKRADAASRRVTIEEARTLPDEVHVQVTGTVLVSPGVLGSQIFYIQENGIGIQIYKYDATFPSLHVGDNVTVSGILSTTRGERRIKIGSEDTINVDTTSSGVSARETDVASLSVSDVGSLVQVEGIVLMRESDKVTIEQEGTELLVRIVKGTGIAPESLERGARLQITGILASYDGELRLMPRFPEDIAPVESDPAILAGTTSGKEQKTQSDSQIALVLTIATLFALTLLAIKRWLPHLQKHYATHTSLRLGAQKVY